MKFRVHKLLPGTAEYIEMKYCNKMPGYKLKYLWFPTRM